MSDERCVQGRRGARTGRLAAAALCAALAVAASGCSNANDSAVARPTLTPVAAPSTPVPSPSPDPPIPFPTGSDRAARSVDIGDGALLGADDRGPVDEAAVVAFADAVFAWLDAHLADLQAGGSGHLADVLPEDLAADDPQVSPALTTAMAAPDHPAATAHYDLTTYHDAGPEFASVVVTLHDPTGAPRTATLVFVPNADGGPELVLGETEGTS